MFPFDLHLPFTSFLKKIMFLLTNNKVDFFLVSPGSVNTKRCMSYHRRKQWLLNFTVIVESLSGLPHSLLDVAGGGGGGLAAHAGGVDGLRGDQIKVLVVRNLV